MARPGPRHGTVTGARSHHRSGNPAMRIPMRPHRGSKEA
ncbi:hypothetical protein FB384_004306 [Prauserella sediminis]|uniref:Uncharacterized protein n=1 Tax=Prauserella sediminis TaxID=577680 RepID=A0A839XY36_9PSEU|nr:hypothetical protein [Prauserella sediminis]